MRYQSMKDCVPQNFDHKLYAKKESKARFRTAIQQTLALLRAAHREICLSMIPECVCAAQSLVLNSLILLCLQRPLTKTVQHAK